MRETQRRKRGVHFSARSCSSSSSEGSAPVWPRVSDPRRSWIISRNIFHDIFGHVPLLANPVFADFLVAYGKGGQRAIRLGRLANLARLYWYTVEFGLIQTPAGLRIFAAGILSSVPESVFALESSSPNRVAFDLQRIMRTKYAIDDFQQTYFVIESFEKLLAECYEDCGPLYERLAVATDIEPFELVQGDEVLTRGALAYFKKDQRSRALQAV
jgi:phenylalanine-4-hydroxylase